MSTDSENKNNFTPWREDANSLLAVFSILAATSGVVLAIVLQDLERFGCHAWLIITLLALSIWLFISTVERVTDALDEDDVEKFVSLFIPYNCAVICLFSGTFIAIYSRFSIALYLFPNCYLLRVIIFFVVLLTINYRWVSHICWLIFKNNSDFNIYIEELKGTRKADYDRKFGFQVFMWLRRHLSKK